MGQDERLLELVGSIYDCAIDPGRWTGTLNGVASYFNAAVAAIFTHDPTRNAVRFFHQWGTDPHYLKLFQDRYVTMDPFRTAAWFRDIDQPFSSFEIVPEDEYRASRIYREWARPQGFYDLVSVALAKTASRHTSVSIIRLERHPRFGRAELQALGLLAPHFRRAVSIADLLDARAVREDTLSATLDLLTVGILLVDTKGRIVHANRAGLRLLEEKCALRREGDHIGACDPKCGHQLREAIASAASGARMQCPKSGIAVPLAAADGRDLAAWVLPLDSGVRNELAAPFAASVAIFVREMGDTSPFPGELFVRRYGLTPAECRVLMMLVQGMTLDETGDALGIGQPTVKTHVQHLFAKTGTRRQPELVRLAMSALAPASR